MSKQPYSEEIRRRLDEFRLSFSPPLTNARLARKLKCGPTQVSKYLNGSPDWNVSTFESTIEDVLSVEEKRRTVNACDVIDTSVCAQIAAVCETIRKTNDVGLISGPAGIGKTIAVERYLRDNPSAIGISITQWTRADFGVQRLLFEAVETRGYKRTETKAGWIQARLRASDRLIVVDNAERLAASGRQFLFDLHDTTRVPLALVGNPELLEAIQGIEKQGTRIGLYQEVVLEHASRVGDEICRALLPGDGDDIRDLVGAVASAKGHLRSLKKHLLLIPELLSACNGDARQAMLAAHTQLVSDYKLS